jgi:xanthine dehydrogenase accessory factor
MSATPIDLPIEALAIRLQREPAVLVHVLATQGSAPRDAGTWMAVFGNTLIGTIGGGRLEFDAIDVARAQLGTALAGGASIDFTRRIALGPSLGQCCGGAVELRFQTVAAGDINVAQQLSDAAARLRHPVALFGGGHVGQALAQLLSRLPVALSWIDSRDGVFPTPPPPGVMCEHSEPPQAAVRGLAAQSRVLIMSFSHAEDLDVLAACLLRQRAQGDLPYIGLIGSKTKWATFRHRLAARGFTAAELAHVTCPIGIPGITGKEPDVIAVAVAAQLLQAR